MFLRIHTDITTLNVLLVYFSFTHELRKVMMVFGKVILRTGYLQDG